MAWLISSSSDTTRLTLSATISVIVTFAPSFARANAVARPIPRGDPAPVTKATLPSNLFFIETSFHFFRLCSCVCTLRRKYPLRNEGIVLRVEVACLTPELKRKPGPERRVASSGIQIPARTPRDPDRPAHFPLYLCIIRLLTLGPHLNGLQMASAHKTQAVQDVGDLSLDHEDHRIVAETGVGTD